MIGASQERVLVNALKKVDVAEVLTGRISIYMRQGVERIIRFRHIGAAIVGIQIAA